MIKKHHKLSYLRKDLARSRNAAWLSQLPGEMIDACLCGQAGLAAWITTHRPELLTRSSIGVLVMAGTVLDVVDHAGWWSLLTTMLDKPPGWARITVIYPESLGKIKSLGVVPSSVSQQITLIRGDLSAMDKIPAEGIDLVYLPISSPTCLKVVLGNNQHHLWKYLEKDASLVVGLPWVKQAGLLRDMADLYGLEHESITNRFFSSEPNMVEAQILVSVHGSKPQNIDAANEQAAWLSDMEDVIKDLCWDILPGQEPEDYRLWGMESIIKSSIDAQDTYIGLPKNLVVRKNTGKIYTLEKELAIGHPVKGAVAEESIATHPGPGGHWTEKAFWAARAWESGIGASFQATLGGAFDKFGADTSDFEGLFNRLNQDSGATAEQIQTLKNVMTGGERYAPSKAERILFDQVNHKNSEGVIDLITRDTSLLHAFNETRSPLLLMLGINGLLDAMNTAISLGADVNAVDGGLRPILVEMAGRASVQAVDLLLKAGASPHGHDPAGWTPLLYAMKAGQWNTVHLLLDHGADPMVANAFGVSPFSIASGEKVEFEAMAHKAFAVMKNILDFDVVQAMKNNGITMDAKDVPESIRKRILGPHFRH